MKNKVLVAGGTGNLGGRIIQALRNRGADVRVLVRPSTGQEKITKLQQSGVEVVQVDMAHAADLQKACTGVSCVVSALQGLHEVIVDAQIALLNAAVAAGVPRFIPSDFASDFTKVPEGENRNFDLRREFHRHLAQAPIAATSILNGAFADMLTYNLPLLDFKKNNVAYWQDADWRMDFTTMDDTAEFTAAAALDDSTPKVLKIASFQISPRELQGLASQITGKEFTLTKMGTLEELSAYNKQQRAAHPEGEKELYPRWQQSQYMHSMFSTQLQPLDNNRYPGIHWTSAKELLSAR